MLKQTSLLCHFYTQEYSNVTICRNTEEPSEDECMEILTFAWGIGILVDGTVSMIVNIISFFISIRLYMGSDKYTKYAGNYLIYWSSLQIT